jgi:hypothetical protein
MSRAGRAPGLPPESRCLQDTPHKNLGSGPQARTHPDQGSNLRDISGGVDIAGTASAWGALRTAAVVAACGAHSFMCVCCSREINMHTLTWEATCHTTA